MCLIIDKNKDYRRAKNGFKVNGVKYVRLVGTNGGIKCSTIVFVSERLADELRRRIDNGRDLNKPLVPAKLEAYRALTCSGSTPVSFPHGVIVVDDCQTQFTADVMKISDENGGEPEMTFVKDCLIDMDASDGFGLMLPSLARRWSDEVGLRYVSAGFNTRFSFEKGMVFTFDFVDFAEKVAGSYFVKDAWGQMRDVREAELILTTSMVKLYDSYDSCESYIENSLFNKYTFGLVKTCPEELENERTLNYQFIQSYYLTDEQIDELIRPTVEEFMDILGGDWVKTTLFLKGAYLTDADVKTMVDDFGKAIMVDDSVLNDPFICKKVNSLIRKRIDSAKVGVLKVHGNYSIISGDPYALCQSMFGLPVTGILRAGELYNKYWVNNGTEVVACFRAPMSCHANIRKLSINQTDEAAYWYQYMDTCTILNAWDTTSMALNGADFDGDLIFTTDNKVLVDNIRPLPALMCMQRRADKKVVTEDDLIQSNINSFGDDIGRTTNWITSMFDVQAQFVPNSTEFKELDYRIMCGQHFQQNSIDKAKGIIAKPMPNYWYDRVAVLREFEDPEVRKYILSIVANKKPYFMRYIYPTLMKDYNKYIRNANKKCIRLFRIKLDDLLQKDPELLTQDEASFLDAYHFKMPVGTNDSVMNKICRKIENALDGYVSTISSRQRFDYTILKSGVEYTSHQYYEIMKLYKEYNDQLTGLSYYVSTAKADEDEMRSRRCMMMNQFRELCLRVCSNEETLCDIILDICYQKEGTKQFAWDMSGSQIIKNLLSKHNQIIKYPQRDDCGSISFGGAHFTLKELELECEA